MQYEETEDGKFISIGTNVCGISANFRCIPQPSKVCKSSMEDVCVGKILLPLILFLKDFCFLMWTVFFLSLY